MPTSEKEIDRIGDIIKNARGTWFVLLGSLVFAAITLASVKDASFFIASEQTKLPLLGISVPITSFFWAGALLITALYTYLHLYLVQLWDALGEADARIGDKPLADVIHPWLVSDAALRVRDKRRGDVRYRPAKRTWKNRWRRMRKGVRVRQKGFMKRFLRDHRVKRAEIMPQSSSQRGMSNIGNLVSVLLVWVLGLTVIFGFWWRSMPAHDIWLTGWLGVLLVWSLYIFWRSGSNALARLEEKQARFPAPIWFGIFALAIVGLTIVRTHYDHWEGSPRINRSELADGCTGHQKDKQKRTWCPYLLNLTQEFIRPARAEMREVVFTQKPTGWTGFDLAKQEFRLRWCKQLGSKACTINPLDDAGQFEEKEEEKFEEAWKRQQEATLATFDKPDLRGKRLEGADLRFAELEGVKLENARLQGAVLWDAKMQGAVLIGAKMQGADLRNAEMQGADLSGAKMQGAIFAFANLEHTNFVNAELQLSNFEGARLYGSDLNGVLMQFSDLSGAQINGADVSFANLERVNLTFASIRSSDLEGASLQHADLSQAIIHGTETNPMKFNSTKLREANFFGVAHRFVSFKSIAYDWKIGPRIRNLNNGFGDGSVELPKGTKWPTKWCKQVLSDSEYWGRYRGWLLARGLGEAYNDEIEKYPLIPFSEPCPE